IGRSVYRRTHKVNRQAGGVDTVTMLPNYCGAGCASIHRAATYIQSVTVAVQFASDVTNVSGSSRPSNIEGVLVCTRVALNCAAIGNGWIRGGGSETLASNTSAALDSNVTELFAIVARKCIQRVVGGRCISRTGVRNCTSRQHFFRGQDNAGG